MLLSCAPAKTNAPAGSNRPPSSGLLCLCSAARCVCIGSNVGGGAGGPWIIFFRSSGEFMVRSSASLDYVITAPKESDDGGDDHAANAQEPREGEEQFQELPTTRPHRIHETSPSIHLVPR